jgi:hypothetical protein
MSVLRELVARLGFQVDGQGFKKAESAVDKVKSNLQKLSQVASLAGIGVGIKKIVDLASDANETANVLEQVFGAAGAAQVKSWSETMSAELGRSQYQLQEFAGRLGAMIEPMVGSKGAAQEMSTTLSKLAVDLGSFFNTTDEDALMALRAGISGESEPLKRFGIVMQDATLQEYAHAQGIHKKISAMSVAEKTHLRYQFILANTATAQGDAARTSGSYANATKALTGAERDLGTEMGQSVMPAIERGVAFVRDGIRAFRDWAKGTNLLKAAMWVLGAAAVWIGASLVAPFVIPALAAAALILLIDELLTLFSGGQTVIGDFIDSWLGIGTVDEYVRNFKAGVELLAEAWSNLWSATDSGNESLAKYVSWMELFETAGVNAYDAVMRLVNAMGDLVRKVPFLGDLLGARELNASDRTGRGMNAPLMTAQESALQNLRDRNAVAKAARENTTGRALAREVDAPVEKIEYGRAAPSAVGATPTVSAPISPTAGVGAKGPVTVNTGATNVVFNMLSGNPEEMRRVMKKTMEAERRTTVAAVSQAGGG